MLQMVAETKKDDKTKKSSTGSAEKAKKKGKGKGTKV